MNDLATNGPLRFGREIGAPDQGNTTGFRLQRQNDLGIDDSEAPPPSGALVASAADDPYCADALEALVMDVEGFFLLLNEPDIQDWAGTEEGLRELMDTIGDIVDGINVFVAECGHLLDEEERRLIAKLRGAMDEAVRGLNRSEGIGPGRLVDALRALGQDAAEVLRIAGGAAARAAGAAGAAATGAILFLLDRLPKPQPF